MRVIEIPQPIFINLGREKIKKRFIQRENSETKEFYKLFSKVKKNLYNYILKTTGFSEEADDIFQDTVLRGFRYFYSYKKELNFKTWIFKIASNEIKKYFKKDKRIIHIIPDLENVPDISKKHEITIIENIYKAVEELSPRDRNIFYLFYQCGFPVNEIAELTGIKNGNIKVILSGSRKKIRQIIGVKNERK